MDASGTRLWTNYFDERQLKEIRFDEIYNNELGAFGTDSHNLRVIIAKMAKLLNFQEETIEKMRKESHTE